MSHKDEQGSMIDQWSLPELLGHTELTRLSNKKINTIMLTAPALAGIAFLIEVLLPNARPMEPQTLVVILRQINFQFFMFLLPFAVMCLNVLVLIRSGAFKRFVPFIDRIRIRKKERQQRLLKHCACLLEERYEGALPKETTEAIERSRQHARPHSNDYKILFDLINWCKNYGLRQQQSVERAQFIQVKAALSQWSADELLQTIDRSPFMDLSDRSFWVWLFFVVLSFYLCAPIDGSLSFFLMFLLVFLIFSLTLLPKAANWWSKSFDSELLRRFEVDRRYLRHCAELLTTMNASNVPHEMQLAVLRSARHEEPTRADGTLLFELILRCRALRDSARKPGRTAPDRHSDSPLER